MTGALFLALAVLQQAPPPEPEAEEIVVTARRQECHVEIADQAVSDGELDRRASEWAKGRPVRVIASSNADVKCLSKIAFKLGDKGVRAITFVTPSGRTAPPIRTSFNRTGQDAPPRPSLPATTDDPSSEQPSISDRERRFFQRRASRLILEGRCDEARKVALENGDIDTAAKVADLCKPAKK